MGGKWTKVGIIMSVMGSVSPVMGHFFNEKAKGWHWYQTMPAPKPESKSSKPKPGDPSGKAPGTATERLAEVRKALDEALAASLLNPTPENVAVYQRLQHTWMNQSHRFSQAWMHNLLRYPELDNTVQHPVTQYGIQIQKEAEQQRMEEVVKSLSQQYGLFFIYQGKCRACKGMAGVVKLLSQKYGWTVLGISQDGVVLPEFPDSKRDNGISQAWGVKSVPAVFVVNPETEAVIPIGHGLISVDQLERNLMLQFTRKGSQ